MPVVPSARSTVGASGNVASRRFAMPSILGGARVNPTFLRASHRQQTPVYRSARGATPEAFGAAEGRALSGLGAAVLDIARQEKELHLKRLDVEFSTRVRELMYGDPETGRGGYMNSRGEAALGSYKTVRDGINAIREDVVGKAQGRDVRNRLMMSVDQNMTSAFTRMAQHSNAQRRSVAAALAEARMENALNDAYNDPALLNKALAVVESETRAGMAAQGLSDPAILESRLRDGQSGVVKNVIGGLLNRKDVVGAAEAFGQYEEFLSAEDRSDLSVALETARTNLALKSVSDEILAGRLDGSMSAADATAAIMQVDDPKHRKIIDSNVQHGLTMHSRQTTEALNGAVADASTFLSGGGMLSDFLAENPGHAARLRENPEKMALLQRHNDAMVEGRTHAETDVPSIAQNYLTMSHSELAAVPPDEIAMLRGSLTKDTHDKVMSYYRAARNKAETEAGGDGGSVERDTYSAANRLLEENIRVNLGIKVGTKMSRGDADVVQSLRREMDIAVEDFVAQNNRQPSNSEIRNMQDELFVEAATGGTNLWLFRIGSKKLDIFDLQQMPIDELMDVRYDFDDVPTFFAKRAERYYPEAEEDDVAKAYILNMAGFEDEAVQLLSVSGQ